MPLFSLVACLSVGALTDTLPRDHGGMIVTTSSPPPQLKTSNTSSDFRKKAPRGWDF